ncbi:hypothetical protein NQ318_003331 [Aromia moschata]|uniref:Transposase n=1 Tax=Aromia moschata TaxID=1265417 RepID=A0AAV8XHV2_9CUCU|nr:hypothetical protein NQ318_003331 [Aromia moschata]
MVNLDIYNRLFQDILWSDESRFISNGKPNRRTNIIGLLKIHTIVNPTQNQGHYGIRVNVWCGIIGRHLIGHYFYIHILDTNSYLRFLRDELTQLLENVPSSCTIICNILALINDPAPSLSPWWQASDANVFTYVNHCKFTVLTKHIAPLRIPQENNHPCPYKISTSLFRLSSPPPPPLSDDLPRLSQLPSPGFERVPCYAKVVSGNTRW